MSDGIKVARLAHVGLRARNLGKQAEFYTDRWGLDAIDEHGNDVFLRADGPDHHVLTLHAGDTAGLDHFAFEVERADDIDRAADIVAGLARDRRSADAGSRTGRRSRRALQGSRR